MATIGAAIAITASLPAPAMAAPSRNGMCDAGEFCLYFLYNADQYPGETGVLDVTGSIPRYGKSQPTCWEFRAYWGGPADTGNGQCVKQNARSAWNRTNKTVRIYMQENCTGDERWVIRAGQVINNLAPFDGDNQSHSVAADGRC